ncbi:hypothetical protein D3C79_1042760 [compost metagenome]
MLKRGDRVGVERGVAHRKVVVLPDIKGHSVQQLAVIPGAAAQRNHGCQGEQGERMACPLLTRRDAMASRELRQQHIG